MCFHEIVPHVQLQNLMNHFHCVTNIFINCSTLSNASFSQFVKHINFKKKQICLKYMKHLFYNFSVQFIILIVRNYKRFTLEIFSIKLFNRISINIRLFSIKA